MSKLSSQLAAESKNYAVRAKELHTQVGVRGGGGVGLAGWGGAWVGWGMQCSG